MVDGGALVKSGAGATDVPKGKMEENARNAEALFESRKVDEIREVEKRTIREAGDKEEELRRGAGLCHFFFLFFPPLKTNTHNTSRPGFLHGRPTSWLPAV